MLTLLHIENIALIEEAEIEFHPGFNVLTGETGAGKSIVVDAISAVLGQRTSRDLIRTGSKSAQVTAVFSQTPPLLAQKLEALDIPPEEELIFKREIRPDGKNICRVLGKPVTVAQLKDLGQELLNIHGQHDGQQLLDPLCHLGYLDSFGKTAPLLEAYQTSYKALGSLQRELQALTLDEGERARKIDSLEFQIQELERAELSLGEDGQLEEKRGLLRSTGKLMEGVSAAQYALSGDEEAPGALALLGQGTQALQSLGRLSPQMAELAQQLEAIRCSAEDVGEVLREFSGELQISPEELEQMESRLDLLYRLKKKYGNTVEEMLAYLDRCREELDRIAYADDRILQIQTQQEQQRAKAQTQAQALSEARQVAGQALTARVVEELRQLDMPKVQFSVEFTPKTCQWALDDSGMDTVQFLMSANLGEALKPIQKVASGGELARIMLAMKQVLAQDDGTPSLVFDEVDTGVSGRAAQKVAEKMAQVARLKQVLCVTHLPQIAAMATAHLQVQKGEEAGRTYTAVTQLDRQGRREELARLIGGTAITPAILSSAEELLSQAEALKQ